MKNVVIMIIILLTGRSVEKSVEEVKDCLEEVNETFEKEKEENMRQIKLLGKYSDQSDVITHVFLFLFLEEKSSSDLQHMRLLVENIQEKMYEFESNMKNNLILYGISQEERETGEMLSNKVREIIRTHFKIARDVVLTNVSRIYTGPQVQGCRPVLGTS